jgi:Skp family chaperone for outer membrane proteins
LFTLANRREKKMKPSLRKQCQLLILPLFLLGCASEKTPATADVAVSRNAVDSATAAGAAELAPAELGSARDKMQRASTALAAKDYATARDLANQASADAKLAQSKANSAKATAAANALQEDIRVLREEVERANKPQ